MKPIVCAECSNKPFKNIQNFRKHVRHFHPSKIEEIFPKKSFKFSCETCKKNFSHKRHLIFHNRKVHNGEPPKQMTFLCPLCVKNVLWDEFTSHVEIMHDTRLVEEYLKFASLDEFTDWKDVIEAEDLNHYIKVRGDRQTGAGILQRYFHCHRSGHYQIRGERLRRLKSQGSKKINAYCPANMKVTINPDGSCRVNYLKTHLGHPNDLRHLTLTRSDRKLLAAASATTDIKFCDIFDEEGVPHCTLDKNTEKFHLITQKDLHNIEAAFSSCGCNNVISIEAWINSMTDSMTVLYYKPSARISKQCFALEEGDYLIVMNEAQCEILKRFGHDCICIDRTHETDSFGFELITLLVVDSMRQGFPCAFLVCNRSDHAALGTFFNSIKEQTGVLKPKVFMSDVDDSLYNIWVSIMEPPDQRLFCTWHINRYWSENLKKIMDPEKQIETYNILRTLLLMERDKSACDMTLYDAINKMLIDTDTKEFALYFKEKFSQNVERWAYCHRLSLGLNVNTHLERLHAIFEYIFFDERVVGRLDKCLYVLMRFVKDQLVDQLVLKHRHYTRIISQTQHLKERHSASVRLHPTAEVTESEGGWKVSTGREISYVKEGDDLCKCYLKCKECETCLHKYICSCVDYSIKWNMCEHIHLVCTFLKTGHVFDKIEESSSSVDGNSSLGFDEKEDQEEDIIAVEKSKKKFHKETVAEEKEALCNEFRELVESISCDDLNIVRKCISKLKPKLKSLQSNNKVLRSKCDLK